ncbi:hypothetical protein K469DRAFT_478323, partial [Zopfia rhizophila CBS 207.26]
MGVIHPFMVVTGSDRRAGKTQYMQPGNKEWITECEMPPNWKVNLSHNGWTNNEIGVAWLKHFDNATRS